METREAPDTVVDCTGLLCPTPVVRTAQAIQGLESGQLLELVATDAGVQPDMTAWAKRTGNELVDITKDGDTFHVFIRTA